MAQKARNNDVDFRPHFKTHQSAEIGEWFRNEGVDKITVSSVMMAEYFHNAGWNDITIAFPVNHREIDRINSLAEKCDLNLIVDCQETGSFISSKLKSPVSVYIEVHTGYHRSGTDARDYGIIEKIIGSVNGNKYLLLKGFLTHFGQTYLARGKQEVDQIFYSSQKTIGNLKEKFSKFFDKPTISIGDTPTCSIEENFEFADEIRPGNFVFYDLMQMQIGSCSLQDIALALAAPVVSRSMERNELVIYGGAVHLSKDFIVNETGEKVFGLAVDLKSNGWEPLAGEPVLTSLSQEHGIIKATGDILSEFKPGSLIGILPVHSCLTSNLMKSYITFENKKISCFQGSYIF